MSTDVIRERLHEYIRFADDKKVEAIYTMVEDEIVEELESNHSSSREKKMEIMRQAAKDPLFLADLKEIEEDFYFVDREHI